MDHNPDSVMYARLRGLEAYETEEFLSHFQDQTVQWDTLLVAHVLEHMGRDEGLALVQSYLPYLREEARLVLICPQEWAYRRDATHVRWVDNSDLSELATQVGFGVRRALSFPWPRWAGAWAPYGEFIVVADR